MKTLLVAMVIIVGIAGVGYWYMKTRAVDAPDYKTFTVARADVVQTVTATGQVNPMTNVTVGSQVSGIVSQLHADFNTPVTKGELLAEIDPATYAAQVAEAKADLANAQAALALTKVTLERDATLLTNRILAQADFDSANAARDQAQAMVMIKQATLQQDQANLDYTKIYAPIDGLVLSRNVDVGQTVAASFSAPTLFIIANDISKMQIDALVSEADIGTIQTNQLVTFTVDAYPMRTFRGTVFQIRNFPETNQNVVCYDTMISVDNSDRKLRPGMTANVSIITAEDDNVLRIPNPALRYHPPDAPDASQVAAGAPAGAAPRGPAAGGASGDVASQGGPGRGGGGSGGRGRGRGSHTVYVLADDPAGKGKVAKPVQVHTGIGDGTFTEITDGLNENDQVIIGQNSVAAAAAASPSNPFGGGGRRF